MFRKININNHKTKISQNRDYNLCVILCYFIFLNINLNNFEYIYKFIDIVL